MNERKSILGELELANCDGDMEARYLDNATGKSHQPRQDFHALLLAVQVPGGRLGNGHPCH